MECTVEPRYNEVPMDWQNVLAIKRFRYIEVLFHVSVPVTGVNKIIRYTGYLVILRVPMYLIILKAFRKFVICAGPSCLLTFPVKPPFMPWKIYAHVSQ